ncbi:transcriptional regulator [Candidatus Scalindua japonica]|uniref:Transcriptional regulator n=1 Tax=Candidatus Scalindua japonica TaxID=1284222 RepID=A0A286U0G9_9BACT|nr:sigma 54-interacting transcriptional regulator [Candidatus Scalindua japonica]GAX61640.1 transcriptional regulator [Candidatus Scalindua japonica]
MAKKKYSMQKLLISDKGNGAEVHPQFLDSDGSIDKSIIDNLDSDVILLDRDLNIILMNKTAEQSCGVSFEEVKGTSYLALRLKSIEQNLANNLNKVFKSGKGLNIRELQLTSPDNATHFFDQSCAPIFDKDGSIQGVLSISKDVTKRVTKEIQYQETRKLLKDLTEELDIKNNEIRKLQTTLGERYHFHNLIGKSYLMQNIYNLIDRVSQTDSTILITGETGTGKELVAKAIHYNSLRKDHNMVAVNCAALPETLLESELFGHVKGSFTGAIRDKKGKFELADKGTIFLDEIGELSTLTQVKLLRVLQEREIERVGGEKSLKVDIRIIAATNQDLLELIEKGEFRKDLFYRLNIIAIRLPSLKERADDIPFLVDHFIEKFNNRFKKNISGISSTVLRKLMSYSWPGNIRELEGVIEKAVLLEEYNTIEKIDLSTDHSEKPQLLPSPIDTGSAVTSYDDMQEHLDKIEKEYFIEVFKKYKGKISDIAEATGLNRRTILNKMKKFSIKKSMFKER